MSGIPKAPISTLREGATISNCLYAAVARQSNTHFCYLLRSNTLLLRQFLGMDYMKRTWLISFSFRDFFLSFFWLAILPLSYPLACLCVLLRWPYA